jgi:hypothetical protein
MLWELLRRRIKNLREVKWALHSRAIAWTKLVCKGSALTIKGNLYLGVMPTLSQRCKGTGVWTQKERFQYLSSARRSIKEKSLRPLLSSRIAKHAMIFSHAFCQVVFPARYVQEDMEKALKV